MIQDRVKQHEKLPAKNLRSLRFLLFTENSGVAPLGSGATPSPSYSSDSSTGAEACETTPALVAYPGSIFFEIVVF
jgi:hypothetical protein